MRRAKERCITAYYGDTCIITMLRPPSGPSAHGLRGEPRLATALPRPRIAAGERREPVEKRRRPERPADRLGSAQRRDEGRVRLFGDQAGEAPAAARKQRRDLDQPVVAAGQMRPHARPGQSSARSTSRALTGFIAT